MKNPKICFITTYFHPTIGGVETHILNLGKELIKLGYEVEVLTSDYDRNIKIKEKYGEIDGIKIKRCKGYFKISFGEVFFPGIFRAAKNSNADIIHVHGYRHLHNFVFLLSKKPIFLTPHWPIYKGQRPKKIQMIVDFVDKFFGKYIFSHISRVCVVTELESPWVESFGVKKENIILTPNCIPEYYFKSYNGDNFRKKYNLKKDDIIAITVSRIHQSKGIDQIVKAAEFFPNVRFVILGKDGGFQSDLEKLINELNLKNIIIGGEVSEKEKLEAYSGADIFCSPSHYEAFCISILEAMSQGCAVLTSNQGGMPWVVGDSGLIFKDNDLEDLKQKLGVLINNKKERERFQKSGKKRAKNFLWENVAKTLDNEYQKVLKHGSENI